LDIDRNPYYAPLKNVPYQEEEVEQVDVCNSWHFKWGSTGLCPLGDGRWYISENSKVDGIQVCDARMYVLSENTETPFIPYIPED
jgi:hypothetical protein